MIQALLDKAAGSITQRGGVALIDPRRPLSQIALASPAGHRNPLLALASPCRWLALCGAFHGFLQLADRFALAAIRIDAALYSSPSAPRGNGAEGGEAPIESGRVSGKPLVQHLCPLHSHLVR